MRIKLWQACLPNTGWIMNTQFIYLSLSLLDSKSNCLLTATSYNWYYSARLNSSHPAHLSPFYSHPITSIWISPSYVWKTGRSLLDGYMRKKNERKPILRIMYTYENMVTVLSILLDGHGSFANGGIVIRMNRTIFPTSHYVQFIIYHSIRCTADWDAMEWALNK